MSHTMLFERFDVFFFVLDNNKNYNGEMNSKIEQHKQNVKS